MPDPDEDNSPVGESVGLADFAGIESALAHGANAPPTASTSFDLAPPSTAVYEEIDYAAMGCASGPALPPWWHDAIDRPEAEERLGKVGKEVGSFLLRASDLVRQKYVLSVLTRKGPRHYHVDASLGKSEQITLQGAPPLLGALRACRSECFPPPVSPCPKTSFFRRALPAHFPLRLVGKSTATVGSTIPEIITSLGRDAAGLIPCRLTHPAPIVGHSLALDELINDPEISGGALCLAMV